MSHSATLLAAFASGRLVEPPSATDPAFDEDAAYAVALQIHETRVARGEQPVGRKIGFTNRSIWDEYGVWAPIWGHVYDTTVQYAADGEARLEIGHLPQPRLEPEIQLHFARTPPVTRDEEAIVSCVDWIALGFEVVQCPYPDWQFTAADSIAACALHGALVVGAPIPVAGVEDLSAKLRSFRAIVFRDGVPHATGGGADVLGSPLLAFAHLTELLAAQTLFEPVHAGEIVSTGTLTSPGRGAAGESWSAAVEGLGLQAITLSLD